jgi:HAD superfamily hydrolase (TIGR01509 family)
MTATLLFDLDGTLVETDWAHLAAFVEVFAQFGLPMDEHIFKTRIMGQPNLKIGEEFFPHLPLARRIEIFEDKEAVYRRIIGKVEPVAGALALLGWARDNGVACGVVTNAPRENADLILEGAGLRQWFGTVVCGQELEHGKPHPMAYLKGLSDLGGDVRRSLAFEDSIPGMTSALRAGLPCAGMTTNLPAATLTSAGATLTAPDMAEPALLAYIRARVSAAA